ncbi:MAG: hypothetical protein ACRDBO_00160 [Lachnospiraceae bacterium]
MNEARAPTNEELKQQALEDYTNGIKPKQLAEKYNLSINTIKSWISRNKAKRVMAEPDAPPKKPGAPAKKKKGAPVGNTNAEGHGAPEGNQNALKHGAYASVYWDSISDTEQSMIEDIDNSAEIQLVDQLKLYTIRERRLMISIQDIKNQMEKTKGLLLSKVTNSKTVEYEGGDSGKGDKSGKSEKKVLSSKDVTNTDTESGLKTLLALEAELTKLQRAKNKCIDSLIHYRMEWKRYGKPEDANTDDVVLYIPDNGR